jgi:hypothetical protein
VQSFAKAGRAGDCDEPPAHLRQHGCASANRPIRASPSDGTQHGRRRIPNGRSRAAGASRRTAAAEHATATAYEWGGKVGPGPRRQIRKARASGRGVLGFVNPPIGAALAVHAAGGQHGAGIIVNAELGAVVVAEGEFVRIALQVLLAAALVNINQPAREDAEEGFQTSAKSGRFGQETQLWLLWVGT